MIVCTEAEEVSHGNRMFAVPLLESHRIVLAHLTFTSSIRSPCPKSSSRSVGNSRAYGRFTGHPELKLITRNSSPHRSYGRSVLRLNASAFYVNSAGEELEVGKGIPVPNRLVVCWRPEGLAREGARVQMEG